MRLLAILPLLLLSGCVLLHGVFGFDLTPNAVHCGQVLGVDVWVDQKDLIDESEPKYSVKAMSCAQAMHTVVQARDVGAQRGLWEADRQFPDYRLEFISARRLGAIDSLGSDRACGYTLTWSHKIAVAYGHDYLEESDPRRSCTARASSCSTNSSTSRKTETSRIVTGPQSTRRSSRA